jgi:hypothetical protein
MINERILLAILKFPYPRTLSYKILISIGSSSFYTFASSQSLAVVLTQRNDEKNEALMSFMSTNIQGDNINYIVVDK